MRTKETDSKKVLQIIAVNVAIARTKKGISQEDLSIMIDKKEDFIERLETLKLKRVTTEDLINIAIILEVSVDSLLTFDYICEKIVY